MDWKRARRPEQKQARKKAILDAAENLLGIQAQQDISASAIAEEAGLSKASLYKYFSTKEEVFLGLLVRHLSDWFASLEEGLEALASSGDIEAISALVVGSLRQREAMTQLLTGLSGELERNLPEETARQFKTTQREQLGVIGQGFERALPGLPEGQGLRLMLWFHALASGLWPMAHPTETMRGITDSPELAVFHVDFFNDLESLFAALIRGLMPSNTSSP